MYYKSPQGPVRVNAQRASRRMRADPPKPSTDDKKPYYKQTWFWILIVVVLLVLIMLGVYAYKK